VSIASDKIANDLIVIHEGHHVDRIRRATERSPAFWTYAITVPLPVPPDSTGGRIGSGRSQGPLPGGLGEPRQGMLTRTEATPCWKEAG
jgi:hypothetical protein